MARPRQAKKNRSSKPRVRTGTAGRTKAGKKKVNFLGNETIRQNWDRKLTLAQNYEKLGLSVKLKGRAGGVEKKVGGLRDSAGRRADSLAISSGVKDPKLALGEVQVIRDEEGNIIEIIDSEANLKKKNPLSDPLNDLEDPSDIDMDIDAGDNNSIARDNGNNTQATRPLNPIVVQLEAQAAAELEELERKKQPRKQSSREEEWIERLVEKYDNDYGSMFRDRKLNPMQQSEGDIKRRVKKWRAKHGISK